jgi:hypothetical protein
MVTAEGYGQENIEVPLAEAVNNRVTLAPATLQVANLDLSGMVVDAEDQPVSGARVFFYGRGQPHREVRSDAKGRFVVHGLCAGAIQIQANTMGTTNLHGFGQAQGGATDVKIVVSPINSRGQPVPPQPRSLVGKSLPSLADLGLDLPTDAYKDKLILLCFFDLGQRPSRRCIDVLVQQADALKEKGVIVAAIQAAAIDEGAWKNWVKERGAKLRFGQIRKDVEKAKSAWGAQSLPWLILTDRSHVLRGEGFDLSELPDKLEAIARRSVAEAKSDTSRAGKPATSAAAPVVPDGLAGPDAGTPAAKAELESTPGTEKANPAGATRAQSAADVWVEMGKHSASGGGISNNPGESLFPAIAIGADGHPVICWNDDCGTGREMRQQIYVKRWDGSGWVELGRGSASEAGISNDHAECEHPQVVLDSGGYPIVCWRSEEGSRYARGQIYVKRWNGSAWVEMGAGSASGGGISNNGMEPHGRPWVRLTFHWISQRPVCGRLSTPELRGTLTAIPFSVGRITGRVLGRST